MGNAYPNQTPLTSSAAAFSRQPKGGNRKRRRAAEADLANATRMPGAAPPRRLWRSSSAVLAGFLAVVVLSIATDEALHLLEVYPPWGQPLFETAPLLLALGYRIVYNVVGGYVTARLAPRNPMRHAVVLGVVGLVLGAAGAIATIPMHLGPSWYPIALVIAALPCAWLGGWLHRHAAAG